MEQILLAYGLPKRTVASIMILYRNTKVKVRFPDGDTDYFDIAAGVLRGDTLAPYLFIICLDNVLRTSIDKIKENGFKLTKKRSRRYPTKTITDADYADGHGDSGKCTRTSRNPAVYSGTSRCLHRPQMPMHKKTEYMCFNQTGGISTLGSRSLKLVDKFYLPRKQCLINQKYIDM